MKFNKNTYVKISPEDRKKMVRDVIRMLKHQPITDKDDGSTELWMSTGDAVIHGTKYEGGTIVIDDCIVLGSYDNFPEEG